MHFPLKHGEEWAWWVFAVSGLTGFASFLCYLGYGYLDTWHGAATLGLLPLYLLGMWKSHAHLARPCVGVRQSLFRGAPREWKTRAGFGRICLLLAGLGKVGAGGVIMLVGMTSVFVPQDLGYLGLDANELTAINPRLIPLIAHDRAGFGGGLLSCGLMVALIVWRAPIKTALWQALLISGTVGFACAIGIHFSIGYTDLIHLGPAILGALIFATGIICTAPATRTGVTRSSGY